MAGLIRIYVVVMALANALTRLKVLFWQMDRIAINLIDLEITVSHPKLLIAELANNFNDLRPFLSLK